MTFLQSCGSGGITDILFPEDEENNNDPGEEGIEEEGIEEEDIPHPIDRGSGATVSRIEGNPSSGALEIYRASNLAVLCVDGDLCEPDYAYVSDDFIKTSGQDPLDSGQCNFDYDPNITSRFELRRVNGEVNGLDLYFSKEDLFFLAWVSLRYKINPYFMMGILSIESAGNCRLVSHATGQGCFQLTYRFARPQLNESYPERVAEWAWHDRRGHYPSDIFVDLDVYFEEIPPSAQYRVTLDPFVDNINNIDVSSVVNFNYGIIGSAMYFHWQQYLLYYLPTRNIPLDDLRYKGELLFQQENGKATWQAAAYNGGAFGARLELSQESDENVADFIDDMPAEARNYGPVVVDYCTEYQSGEDLYDTNFNIEDIDLILDLLYATYPEDIDVDWDEVFFEIDQIFFSEGNEEINFTDDIKALVYVISTFLPDLAPEWTDNDSIGFRN